MKIISTVVINEVDVMAKLNTKDKINFEFDDEGNNASGNTDEPAPKEEPTDTDEPKEDNTDTKADTKQQEPEDTTETEPTDGNPPEEQPEEEPGEDTAPDETDENNDGIPEENPNDSESTEQDNNVENDLKDIERKLFSDLSDDQMMIRDKELRRNYVSAYNTCNSIIDNIKIIPKSSLNVNVLAFINNKAEELKTHISDYVEKSYATKTYLENQENYLFYIVILNRFDKLFKELGKK